MNRFIGLAHLTHFQGYRKKLLFFFSYPHVWLGCSFRYPYPSLEEIAPRIFRLPGSVKPVYITPDDNYCGLCGKMIRSKWCPHLISAGLKVDPPVYPKGHFKLFFVFNSLMNCIILKFKLYAKLVWQGWIFFWMSVYFWKILKKFQFCRVLLT